jgi:hypothetical protein
MGILCQEQCRPCGIAAIRVVPTGWPGCSPEAWLTLQFCPVSMADPYESGKIRFRLKTS